MAHVALLRHAKPKSKKTKTHISKVLSDHAVANTWWDPSSMPDWLTEQCYIARIQPLLKGKKVREIAEAMQVSQPYAAFVRSADDARTLSQIATLSTAWRMKFACECSPSLQPYPFQHLPTSSGERRESISIWFFGTRFTPGIRSVALSLPGRLRCGLRLPGFNEVTVNVVGESIQGVCL
jgi:hypothetical protein